MKYLKGFNKRVKGFNDFMSLIKESIDFWKDGIDDLDFEDYLEELVASGFRIDINKGFVDCVDEPKLKGVDGDPNQLKLFPIDNYELDDDLIGDPLSYEDDDEYLIKKDFVCPSYSISISSRYATDLSDLTEVLNFFRRIVLSEHEYQTAILTDDDDLIDFEDIKINDGNILYRDTEGSFIRVGEHEEDVIKLIVMSTKPIEVKIKDIADYYSWSGYDDDGKGGITFDVPIDRMADVICANREQEKIISGEDYDLDYDIHYDIHVDVDVDSLIRYYLNSDAEKILAKCVILELGGIDNIDSGDIDGMSEEEVIDFLTSENYRRLFVELGENSILLDDIKMIYSDMYRDSYYSTFYNDLFNEFDDIVDKSFDNTYDKNERMYKINFNSEWLDDLYKSSYEYDYFKNADVEYIALEWYVNEIGTTEISLHDVNASVDTDELSGEVIRLCENYLKNSVN